MWEMKGMNISRNAFIEEINIQDMAAREHTGCPSWFWSSKFLSRDTIQYRFSYWHYLSSLCNHLQFSVISIKHAVIQRFVQNFSERIIYPPFFIIRALLINAKTFFEIKWYIRDLMKVWKKSALICKDQSFSTCVVKLC